MLTLFSFPQKHLERILWILSPFLPLGVAENFMNSRCSYYLQIGWCLWGPSTQKGQYQKDSDRSCFKCEYFPQIMNYLRHGFAYAPRLIDLMFKMFQRRTQFHHHSRAVQTAAPPTPCPPPPRSASSISSSRCFSSSTTSTSNPLTGASTCQNKKRALN